MIEFKVKYYWFQIVFTIIDVSIITNLLVDCALTCENILFSMLYYSSLSEKNNKRDTAFR